MKDNESGFNNSKRNSVSVAHKVNGNWSNIL